jgi:hypothetical protein
MNLATVRAEHRARWNAAAQAPEPRGGTTRPWHNLMDVSCWLIDQGIANDEPCDGELHFGMPLSRVRTYLDGLSHAERRAAVEAGRRIIFEGRRAWFPATADLRIAA